MVKDLAFFPSSNKLIMYKFNAVPQGFHNKLVAVNKVGVLGGHRKP